jgi:uncharacterized protein (TIGR02996 family)
MSTSETELLEAIWKNPRDRAALSVYADWLIEHGDATRGEYIQLSLIDGPSTAQSKRRTALKNRHRGAWLGAARKFVWTWEESEETPGFVAKAQCSMPKLAAGLENVRMLGPRLVINASEPKAKREIVALAKRPLGTLWGLSFVENDAMWITDEALAILAPSLDGLRALALHSEVATMRGWNALLPHLSELCDLELGDVDEVEAWLETLFTKTVCPNLVRLAIPGGVSESMRNRLSRARTGCAVESWT